VVIVFIATLLSYDLRSERSRDDACGETFWGPATTHSPATPRIANSLLGVGHHAHETGDVIVSSFARTNPMRQPSLNVPEPAPFLAGKRYGHEASQSFRNMPSIL
jgi:hypothetical protein